MYENHENWQAWNVCGGMKSDGRKRWRGRTSTVCHPGACAATRASPAPDEWASPVLPRHPFPVSAEKQDLTCWTVVMTVRLCTHARLECMNARVLEANHPCGAVERARWICSPEQLSCPVAQMERRAFINSRPCGRPPGIRDG